MQMGQIALPPADSSLDLTRAFARWRWVHRLASGLLGLLALVHATLTFVIYRGWSADAVWFLGTGLGLLVLATVNLAHVGVEPCRLPTAAVIRRSNWLFALFGVAAVMAVPQPQAYAVLVGLLGQAVAGRWTLPGPA